MFQIGQQVYLPSKRSEICYGQIVGIANDGYIVRIKGLKDTKYRSFELEAR